MRALQLRNSYLSFSRFPPVSVVVLKPFILYHADDEYIVYILKSNRKITKLTPDTTYTNTHTHTHTHIYIYIYIIIMMIIILISSHFIVKA